MEKIGEKIHQLRKAKGISQEELAEYVGVSRQTIYKWEADIVQPNYDNIKSLCEVLSVKMEYFFGKDLFVKTEGEIAAANTSPLHQKSIKGLIIGVCITSIAFVFSGYFSLWFGLVVFTSNKGDVSMTMPNFTVAFFCVAIILMIILLILDILFIIKIVKRKQCK